jgi:hypothetical protein
MEIAHRIGIILAFGLFLCYPVDCIKNSDKLVMLPTGMYRC